MTFTDYTPFAPRRSGEVYPPVAAGDSIPRAFETSYEGSAELHRRIRSALTAYAIRDRRFWLTDIYLVGLCVVVGLLLGNNKPAVYLPTFGLGILMALAMIVTAFVDINHVSRLYSNERETYSASFKESSIIWRTQTGVYEIPLNSISRAVTRQRVTVLGITDSRAICVLPEELITPAAREWLDRDR
jgi:hypothetical protein